MSEKSPIEYNENSIEDFSIEKEVKEAVSTTGYYTYAEEAKLLRRVDLRIMPLLVLLYLCKNLDVNNISYILTINKSEPGNVLAQLAMTKDEWAWTSTIYFIPFVIFEIPSTLLLKKTTPRIHQFRIAFLWGVVTACQSAVKNKQGLYALRFLLGFFEAGMFPGMLAHLVYWYRPDEASIRIAILGVLGSFSSVLSAFITYGFSFANGKGGLSGWQWVFLVEGIFSIVCSVGLYFWLPNFPNDSKWLSDQEKAYLIARLPPQAPKSSDKAFDIQGIIKSLLKPTTLLFVFLKFFQGVGTYGLSFWLPSIIQSFGITSSTTSPLMTIPSSAAAVFSGIFFSYLVDLAWYSPATLTSCSMIVSIGAFIVLAVVTNKAVLYAFIIIATVSTNANGASVISWMAHTLEGSSQVGFNYAFTNAVAQLGGIIGPQIYREKYAPRYVISYIISLIFIAAGLVLNVALWWLTRNKMSEVIQDKKKRLKQNKNDPNDKPVYNQEFENITDV
ncbi:hypothetical protein DASC09_018490 [Saccharomycopsis crataegensis]|uniref:Major facilitator superfamily (MFS) profile domain-containing protein n=1 Tax=Saccharomycopsis crataegensis TaxID=43959 RepID=A0AAV5QIH2_9ASCO|nr:hypothetical protein DASC09_018490 [Saccharomycopsis crataegensis]